MPKYRGAAPITWAVVRGETETGVTLMQMDAGMDTGAMLETWRIPIGADETAGELSERLSELGARAVREGVPKVIAGGYVPEPQDESRATLAPMLKKEDGAIDFAKSARAVHDHVRGMSPWPGAFTRLAGKAREGASGDRCRSVATGERAARRGRPRRQEPRGRRVRRVRSARRCSSSACSSKGRSR